MTATVAPKGWTFECRQNGGLSFYRADLRGFTKRQAALRMAEARAIFTGCDQWKVVPVGYEPEAPEPTLEVAGSCYAWKCDDGDLSIYGDSRADARARYLAQYRAERGLDVNHSPL